MLNKWNVLITELFIFRNDTSDQTLIMAEITTIFRFLFTVLLIVLTTHGKRKQKENSNSATIYMKLLDVLQGECRAYEYDLDVHRKDCKPKRIRNKFCGGKCPSVVLPKQLGWIASCSICKPKIVIRRVFLDCPKDEVKQRRHRKVKMVTGCSCQKHPCSLALPFAAGIQNSKPK